MSAKGSVEDIIESVTNPKLRFEEKEIPRGSPAFQMVITDVTGKNKDEENSDSEEEREEKPKRRYHGRRRNTIAHIYQGEPPEWTSILANARRMSTLPEIGELSEELTRGRRASLCPPPSRSRSLSPITAGLLRRSSVAFGSSKERETVIK